MSVIEKPMQDVTAPAPAETEISVTLSKGELRALDLWIERHTEPRPSRPQALRRLLICGLTGHPGQ